jgi:hypothetical protein
MLQEDDVAADGEAIGAVPSGAVLVAKYIGAYSRSFTYRS